MKSLSARSCRDRDASARAGMKGANSTSGWSAWNASENTIDRSSLCGAARAPRTSRSSSTVPSRRSVSQD
eukprot:30937-Pelagococcus_subviridis.AAC.19